MIIHGVLVGFFFSTCVTARTENTRFIARSLGLKRIHVWLSKAPATLPRRAWHDSRLFFASMLTLNASLRPLDLKSIVSLNCMQRLLTTGDKSYDRLIVEVT